MKKHLLFSLLLGGYATLAQNISTYKGNSPCYCTDSAQFKSLKQLPFKADSNLNKVKTPFLEFHYVRCEGSNEVFVQLNFQKKELMYNQMLITESYTLLYDIKGHYIQGSGTTMKKRPNLYSK